MERRNRLKRAGAPDRFPGRLRDWGSPRRKRFWALTGLIVYTLAGFFLAPWITQRLVVSELGELLDRPVSLERVRINPFVLSIEARGLAIQETDGSPLIAFERLFVNWQLASLFRWAWTFREITLEAPAIELLRSADGQLNLARLIPATAQQPAEATDDDEEFVRVVIHEFNLIRGRVAFTDHVPSPSFELPVGPIDIHVQNISTIPDESGNQRVLVESEGGTRIAWDGTLQVEPFQSAGHVTASGPYLPLLYRYFQEQIAIEARRGTAELAFDYEIALRNERDISARVEELKLTVQDVAITQEDIDILIVPELVVEGGWLEYPERSVGAERYRISDASVMIWRNPDGTSNVEHIARAADTDADPGAIAEPASASTDAATELEPDAQPFEDWALSLGEAVIANLAFQLEDRTLESPGFLEATVVDLTVSDLSNTPGARFPLELAVNIAPGGGFTLDGEIGVLPAPSLDAILDVTELKLAAIQPYMSEIANVTVDDGVLSTRSELTIREDEPFGVSGDLRFAALSIADTLQQQKLVGWEEFTIDSYRFSTAQKALQISELVIGSPYLRLLIAEDQTTNFQQLLVERPAVDPELQDTGDSKDAADPGGPSPTITVGRVRIESGSADFTDLALPLPFRSKIVELNGEVSTLDTGSREPSEVRIEGQVDDYGLARIEGSILPLGPEQNTDLAVLFRNVELPDLTPYTIRFAGRKIDDGRMDLDLRYRVEEGQLVGSNSLVIRDLKLGDKVEYPDAFNLPLGLAVALLKGPDGRIDLDVPVKGDVNDPEFRLGGVIVKAIVNIITNIVASPFRLLGSLVGMDSDEFDKLEFEPGRAELTPPERGKLAKLAEALSLRPQLTLSIPPVVAPQADPEALRVLQTDARIETLLADSAEAEDEKMFAARRAEVIETLFRGDFPEVDLDELRSKFRVPVDPDQPDGETTFDETAYIAEMRNRLVQASDVSDAALEALALDRANAVVSALTEAGQVDPSRFVTGTLQEAAVSDEGWVQMTLEVGTGSSGALALQIAPDQLDVGA